ncbi:MAG TPA: nucleoside triphosphate pyrophosphatase [Cellvibrionaceae bacterium]
MLPIILASSSPYRRQLLERLHLPYQAQSPAIDETPYPGEAPEALAARLARGKAEALAGSHPGALIIGSDQVASIAGQLLDKPGNKNTARMQLQACSGQCVSFYTGLCLLNSTSGRLQQHVEPFRVHFRQLSNEEIDNYLDAEQPFDCAGSFKCEGLGIALFSALEGRDNTALVGLPLIALCDLLRKEGINPLATAPAPPSPITR